MGAGAIWYLLRRDAEEIPKNWHFYAKLVSVESYPLQAGGRCLHASGTIQPFGVEGFPLTNLQTVIAALVLTTALQASLQIESYPHIWLRDFRFWTSILTLGSLIVIFGAQYFEHWRSMMDAIHYPTNNL
jgi:hypothetical protein